jgi:hypothetical protein
MAHNKPKIGHTDLKAAPNNIIIIFLIFLVRVAAATTATAAAAPCAAAAAPCAAITIATTVTTTVTTTVATTVTILALTTRPIVTKPPQHFQLFCRIKLNGTLVINPRARLRAESTHPKRLLSVVFVGVD